VLLPYDLIAQAENSQASEVGPLPENPGANWFAGIDFGRQSDPTVCWLIERVGDVLWTREVLVLHKMDTPAQEEILRARVKLCQRVCFDYTGPGVGLGDYLAKEWGEWDAAKHRFGRVELCTFTSALKREMFPRLRRTFETPTRIRVPISRAVREDLHAMQQTQKNGQYDYWAPRTREGHSDRCTAAALAVRAAGEGIGFGITVK
jgi:phage FluMu gp28-like protein